MIPHIADKGARPVANGSGRHVTSGQRVVAAAALVDRARLSLAEASVWADAWR